MEIREKFWANFYQIKSSTWYWFPFFFLELLMSFEVLIYVFFTYGHSSLYSVAWITKQISTIFVSFKREQQISIWTDSKQVRVIFIEPHLITYTRKHIADYYRIVGSTTMFSHVNSVVTGLVINSIVQSCFNILYITWRIDRGCSRMLEHAKLEFNIQQPSSWLL